MKSLHQYQEQVLIHLHSQNVLNQLKGQLLHGQALLPVSCCYIMQHCPEPYLEDKLYPAAQC